MADPLVKSFALMGSDISRAPILRFTIFVECRGLFSFWRNDLPCVVALRFWFRSRAIIALAPLSFLLTFWSFLFIRRVIPVLQTVDFGAEG